MEEMLCSFFADCQAKRFLRFHRSGKLKAYELEEGREKLIYFREAAACLVVFCCCCGSRQLTNDETISAVIIIAQQISSHNSSRAG
jgi:hypothetical protein